MACAIYKLAHGCNFTCNELFFVNKLMGNVCACEVIHVKNIVFHILISWPLAK
jgi:hypothetical protein